MTKLLVYTHPTLAAYARHAAAAITDWRRIKSPSRFLRWFAAALPPRARVLDYGCGIGLELAWLGRQGFRVEGVDGTPAFVMEARRRNPGVPVHEARFETWPMPAGRPTGTSSGRYDGIWCQAALIHVPPEELRRQLTKLRQGLMPGGVAGLTLAWGRARGHTRYDWIPGRYLAAYSKAEAAALFRGWTVRELRVTSHDGRQGRWIHILAS